MPRGDNVECWNCSREFHADPAQCRQPLGPTCPGCGRPAHDPRHLRAKRQATL